MSCHRWTDRWESLDFGALRCVSAQVSLVCSHAALARPRAAPEISKENFQYLLYVLITCRVVLATICASQTNLLALPSLNREIARCIYFE